MTQWRVFDDVISVEIDGADMECSMQRLSISSVLVFMTKLSGGNNCFKVRLDNQATLHVFKNEVLVSNIHPNDRARNIGGIDDSQSGMSTEQICGIQHVEVGYFNKNAVADILIVLVNVY